MLFKKGRDMNSKIGASSADTEEALESSNICDASTIDSELKDTKSNTDNISAFSIAVDQAARSGAIPARDADLIQYTQGYKDWPDPEPLIGEEVQQSYPLDSLPPIIKEAVEEVVDFVQCPVPIAASSALGVLSAASQGLADVSRAEGLSGPISVNLLVIADSGERKTTVDTLFSKPIKDWEQKKNIESIDAKRNFETDNLIWQSNMEGLKKSLIRSQNNNHDDIEDIESKIKSLMCNKPKKPIVPRIMFTDTTPEALASTLACEHHSGAIISSEAGSVLGGHSMNQESIMRNLSLLNTLWDGGNFYNDRRSSEKNFVLQGARLTISISVQHETFIKFLEKSNGLVRGIGFMARFLFAFPKSTQGNRLFKDYTSWDALNRFYETIVEILDMPLRINEFGEINPSDIKLSPEAQQQWIAFHNEIETELGVGGEYESVKDVASKTADNAARIAAQFHIVENGLEGEISLKTFTNAAAIAKWHLNEFKRFTIEGRLPEITRQALKLRGWLIPYCLKNNIEVMELRHIVNYGPYQLRKTSLVRECLDYLCIANGVFWIDSNIKTRIRINPKLFKCNS